MGKFSDHRGGVKIGNNVFIGMKSTILKGVHIGNNVIVGANSLVNKNVPDNCIVVGNPARVVMTLDQYYRKRKKAQLTEATELVQLYRERYGKEPDDRALHEFFWLFSDGNDELPECWEHMQNLVGNRQQTDRAFAKNKKICENMEEFLKRVK